MFKRTMKYLCAVLALLLMSSMIACLAETEQESYTTYEKLNKKQHTVTVETWEYPIVDGERGSGKPVSSSCYTEDHKFDGDECAYCGYSKKTKETDTGAGEDESDDDDTTSGNAAEDAPAALDTFATASGATVTKGMSAAAALKAVFAAIPADAQLTIGNVDAEVADKLIELIDNGGAADALLELLKNFPVQQVDGVECYVVTISYTDANGNSVTENYAFSTADATLVKVF